MEAVLVKVGMYGTVIAIGIGVATGNFLGTLLGVIFTMWCIGVILYAKNL